MNWYHFCSNPRFSRWSTSDFIPKNTIFGKPENILAFDKLRVLRYYLVQICYPEDFICEQFCLNGDDWLHILFADRHYEVLMMGFSRKIHYLQNIAEQISGRNAYGANKHIVEERELLQKAFYLYLGGELSPLQVYLLNTYILGVSQFKFFFYQDNVNMGFEKFKWAEKVKEHFLPNDYNDKIYETVFDKYYSEERVTQIEFRITPGSYKKLLEIVKSLDKANDKVYEYYHEKDPTREKIKYGLILHYIKEKEEFELEDGLSRKENYLAKLQKSSKDLYALISNGNLSQFDDNTSDSIGYYINKIIGIDTANYELNCRPELFGYTFRKLREEAAKSHHLYFTYHVGEDFNTISNGLRAIDEVIEFLQFRRGDRLGHAIALGISVKRYFEVKRKKVVSRLEEYLDDIAWMYGVLVENSSSDSEVLAYLILEFNKYKNMYFMQGEEFSIFDYMDAYNLRGDAPNKCEEFYDLDAIQYQNIIAKNGLLLNYEKNNHETSFSNSKARKLYYKYHFSRYHKEAGRKVLVFDVNDLYIKAVELCQHFLKDKICNLEISIETNPSSNRKISYINKYIDLPLMNFAPLNGSDEDSTILVSINTDDSAVFQTDLQAEYAYVVAAQIREGGDIEKVYNYVETLRKNSYVTSFLK
ncbi:MAG: hypothetical protein ACK5JF_00180 [Oscillospiraceae bacterium]